MTHIGHRGRRLLAGMLAFALASCATTPRTAIAPPAGASAATEQPRIFVATANPLSAEAGLAVLRRGGSAIDAAIAMQAMLALVVMEHALNHRAQCGDVVSGLAPIKACAD